MNASPLLLGLLAGATGVAYFTVPEFKVLADKAYDKASKLAENMADVSEKGKHSCGGDCAEKGKHSCGSDCKCKDKKEGNHV